MPYIRQQLYVILELTVRNINPHKQNTIPNWSTIAKNINVNVFSILLAYLHERIYIEKHILMLI